MTKISIIGAGGIGATTAHITFLKKLGDIVLVDIVEGLAKGKAFDMLQAAPVECSDFKISGTNDYADTKDSDIIVITAGSPRKPGMTREDLLEINKKIITSVTREIIKHSPNAILIVVTNPMDIMTYVVAKESGFPKQRIIGMGGILDTARYKTFVAQELNVSVNDVKGFVIGQHGGSMVPVASQTIVKDKKLTELLPKEKINEIIEKTKKAGAEVIKLAGLTCYAPVSSIVKMIDIIVNDKKEIVPCSVFKDNIFIGWPVKLGKNGVEEIVEIDLSNEEKELFGKAVEHIRGLVEKI